MIPGTIGVAAFVLCIPGIGDCAPIKVFCLSRKGHAFAFAHDLGLRVLRELWRVPLNDKGSIKKSITLIIADRTHAVGHRYRHGGGRLADLIGLCVVREDGESISPIRHPRHRYGKIRFLGERTGAVHQFAIILYRAVLVGEETGQHLVSPGGGAVAVKAERKELAALRDFRGAYLDIRLLAVADVKADIPAPVVLQVAAHIGVGNGVPAQNIVGVGQSGCLYIQGRADGSLRGSKVRSCISSCIKTIRRIIHYCVIIS